MNPLIVLPSTFLHKSILPQSFLYVWDSAPIHANKGKIKARISLDFHFALVLKSSNER